MKSIRARLLAGLLCGMLLVLLAGTAVIFLSVQDEVAELFDYQLEQTAYEYAAQSTPLPEAERQAREDDPEADFVIQVWDAAGALRFQSRPAWQLPRGESPGFSLREVGNNSWRVFDADVGSRWVQVAQPLHVRSAVASDIAMRTLLLFSPLFPLAGLLIWLTVGRGLRPLERVAEDVRRRSHRDLGPIDPQPLPREVAPLAAALNDLLSRLGRVIGAQKTFIADAAHELLTPITALQLQAQLLSRASDEAEKQEALSNLRAGLARTMQMAQQLLTLARQDADLEKPLTAVVDLAPLTQRVISSLQPLAEAKSIAIELRAVAAAKVLGEGDALATMLGNLLDNAVKYTPAGGRISVAVEQGELGTTLLVEDSGPGIPAEDRERVFDRFYRRPGSGLLGSGLGLPIARDIATRHRASVALFASADLGGLGVRVLFAAEGLAAAGNS